MIDLLYINEAKRIRSEYIKNLKHISDKEDIVNDIMKDMEKLKSELEVLDEADFKIKVKELGEILIKVENDILPYHKEIEKLNKDQQKLYSAIKEKYPHISDEEIQEQVIPHIIELDKKMRK